jgi:hypothetical protein
MTNNYMCYGISVLLIETIPRTVPYTAQTLIIFLCLFFRLLVDLINYTIKIVNHYTDCSESNIIVLYENTLIIALFGKIK